MGEAEPKNIMARQKMIYSMYAGRLWSNGKIIGILANNL